MADSKIALDYDACFLETNRPKPLSDRRLDSLAKSILNGNFRISIDNKTEERFIEQMQKYLLDNNNINHLRGLENFQRIDIINGCTQSIDSVYMHGPVQTLKGDYTYHTRLNPNIVYSVEGNLVPNVPLILALPFPSLGKPHPNTKNILNECCTKNIPVHIDGAWLSCSKNIDFNFDHTAICSVSISLSKGLALGWNRIGLRWSRNYDATDAISLNNDYHMTNKAMIVIAQFYMDNIPSGYLWQTHGKRYAKICRDFNLKPTNAIHLALDKNNQPVGVSPLIRYLEQHGI